MTAGLTTDAVAIAEDSTAIAAVLTEAKQQVVTDGAVIAKLGADGKPIVVDPQQLGAE